VKNSEIAALVIIASLSMLIAYFVADAVIGKPTGESVKVKTIAPITADIQAPDSSIFNKDAINPTVEVVIGNQ
jgi:hypothetical protein